jgi:YebC/PmpR family DNA-binding regulatory protein
MGRKFEVRKAAMAKTSAAKSKLYSKYGKELYVAAKSNPSIDANPTLKRLVDRAKKLQVPAHVIEKAIEKAKGSGGEDFQTARYEGYGPGGSMIIVDCLTDNVNRTVSEVRNCFTKTDSKMGVSGCVQHMFSHQSVFVIKGLSEEEAFETVMMADCEVEDIETEEDTVTLYASHTEFYKIKTALEETGCEIEVEEITWIPSTFVTLDSEDDIARFEKFMNMLDDCEDVQDVYHNVEE